MQARTLATVALVTLPALTQQFPTWTQVSSSGPVARMWHSMTYDAARGEVVLFGGQVTGVGLLSDTWVWNGTAWLQRNVNGPAPCDRSAFAFDRARGEVILFGGARSGGAGLSDETWAWNGNTWTLRQPVQAPIARYAHAMAYDERRQRLVLFGGGSNTLPAMADTWEWDGAIWSPRPSAVVPTPHAYHAMTYDTPRGECVVFGGSDGSRMLAETWAWNGANWAQRSPAVAPLFRTDTAFAFFASRQYGVLFGGHSNGSNQESETWYWDGVAWINRTLFVGSPPGRWGHAMAYDSQRDELIMFGGQTQTPNFNDRGTWRMTIPGLAGSFQAFGVGCSAPLVLNAAIGSVPRIGRTFDALLTSIPASATGAFMTLGFSRTFVGPFPLPLPLDFAGMTGCTLYHDLYELLLPVVQSGATATYTLSVPGIPALAGTHVYLQGGAFVPAVNPAGLIASNAGDLLIGT